jgi:hypothetical protein
MARCRSGPRSRPRSPPGLQKGCRCGRARPAGQGGPVVTGQPGAGLPPTPSRGRHPRLGPSPRHPIVLAAPHVSVRKRPRDTNRPAQTPSAHRTPVRKVLPCPTPPSAPRSSSSSPAATASPASSSSGPCTCSTWPPPCPQGVRLVDLAGLKHRRDPAVSPCSGHRPARRVRLISSQQIPGWPKLRART